MFLIPLIKLLQFISYMWRKYITFKAKNINTLLQLKNKTFLLFNEFWKRSISINSLIPPSPDSWNTPCIWFFIFVIQRFQALVFLKLAKFCGIGELEESWCKLYQPLGINCCDFSHILLCCLYQLMIYNPAKIKNRNFTMVLVECNWQNRNWHDNIPFWLSVK